MQHIFILVTVNNYFIQFCDGSSLSFYAIYVSSIMKYT